MADSDTDVTMEMPASADPARTEDATPPADGDRYNRERIETIVGGAMLALVAVGALFFHWHPAPIFLDRWGFSLVHPAIGNHGWRRITDLRSVSFLVAGSILAALVVVARDRWRALVCLVTPIIAVLITEYVLKPVVGRRYAEVLSFPSGTTTVVGSVAMAWVIAVPKRFRLAVVVIAAFVVGLEIMAVVALQWHYPADALAGAFFGAGLVLLADGLVHLAVAADRRRRGVPTGARATAGTPMATETPVAAEGT